MDDYKATVQSARSALGIAVQMEELFPVADHFITEFGFDDKPKIWNTEVFFGGRYTLTMQVLVEIDYQQNAIIKLVKDPKFYLVEAAKIEILPDGRTSGAYNSRNARQFGVEEWNKLYEAKGDFSSIGIQLNPTPVPNFEEDVSQARRDRVPSSLIDQ